MHFCVLNQNLAVNKLCVAIITTSLQLAGS
nr:MAG TPA: hypothetical protein [Caudoviricetes sp.]